MSKYQTGDRVIWEGHPGDSGTVCRVDHDGVHVFWDSGEEHTYRSVWGLSRITLTARIPNPTFQFCRHGGVDAGKHCPICLGLKR